MFQECKKITSFLFRAISLNLGLFNSPVDRVDFADRKRASISGSNHIPGDLDVVICKLSNLGIVNTHDLILLGRSKAETRNEVDNEENDAGADERVGKTADGVGQLVSELDVVLVEPSSRNDGSAVKVRNVVSSKETSKEVPDETTNTVNSINIKSIINAHDVLELGTVVASSSTDDTKDHGGPGWDVTRGRSNGDETSNDTRAETDSRPLLLESVVENTPGDTSDRSSQVGDNSGHDGAEVGAQGRTGVETEPADPEEDGTDDDVSDVVRAVVEFVSSVTTTLAEHQGVGQSGSTG